MRLVVTLLLLLTACAESFETSETGEPTVVGCSDGSREGYEDEERIAACAGGFEIPGVTTPASLNPQCDRAAGNDGEQPEGSGCSVEDLCATNWHVCASAEEVSTSASTGNCPVTSSSLFWLTRQTEDLNGACAAQGSNNLVGCAESGVGEPAPPNCGPLITELRWTHCDPLGWRCGTSAEANSEAEVVHKPRAGGGGVLCCRD